MGGRFGGKARGDEGIEISKEDGQAGWRWTNDRWHTKTCAHHGADKAEIKDKAMLR